MTSFNQLVLDQNGEKKVDPYPNILPPRDPPGPGEAAQEAPRPRQPWWWNVYVQCEAIMLYAEQVGMAVTPEGARLYAWLAARNARLARND